PRRYPGTDEPRATPRTRVGDLPERDGAGDPRGLAPEPGASDGGITGSRPRARIRIPRRRLRRDRWGRAVRCRRDPTRGARPLPDVQTSPERGNRAGACGAVRPVARTRQRRVRALSPRALSGDRVSTR